MRAAVIFVIALSGCAHGAKLSSHPVSKEIVGDGFKLTLNSELPSLPGTFFLGIIDASKLNDLPMTSHLIALKSDGVIEFQRTFINHVQPKAVANFRPLNGREGYAYFIGDLGDLGFPGEFHVLDDEFHDFVPQRLPSADGEFDGHDFGQGSDGSFFFLFEKKHLGRLAMTPEIQHWDKDGKIRFVWSGKEWRRRQTSRPDAVFDDIYTINSIDSSLEKRLLVSFREMDTIAEIEVPSGKMLYEISREKWTFVNDEFGGFVFQHCVRRLPDGNILLFDDGNGSRPARAVEYRLDIARRVATLVWEYRFPEALREGWAAGSIQRLPNGNTLIGWGGPRKPTSMRPRPIFTEVDPAGRVVRSLSSDKSFASYSVFFEESATFDGREASSQLGSKERKK